MKNSTHTVTVKASADHAWKIIGEDFVAVERWMAANPTAEAIAGPALPGAPAKGRNSYLIQKLQPMYQEEVITAYSDAKRSISTRVIIRKAGKFVPMLGYVATVTVKPVDEDTCTIIYTGHALTKWFSGPMRGMLTKALHPGFLRGLEELAHYIETGEPHPRKIDKIKSEAALEAA
jgi:hypothetical protein